MTNLTFNFHWCIDQIKIRPYFFVGFLKACVCLVGILVVLDLCVLLRFYVKASIIFLVFKVTIFG